MGYVRIRGKRQARNAGIAGIGSEEQARNTGIAGIGRAEHENTELESGGDSITKVQQWFVVPKNSCLEVSKVNKLFELQLCNAFWGWKLSTQLE